MVVVGGIDILIDGVIVVVGPTSRGPWIPETRVAAVLRSDGPRRALLEAGRVGGLVILGNVVPGVVGDSPAVATVDGRKSAIDTSWIAMIA